uniref:Uncharacterized protein n=1 Tax=Anguilla anguilla TaxID=7936 RepID=A0A0E9TIK2_ANGAN
MLAKGSESEGNHRRWKTVKKHLVWQPSGKAGDCGRWCMWENMPSDRVQ